MSQITYRRRDRWHVSVWQAVLDILSLSGTREASHVRERTEHIARKSERTMEEAIGLARVGSLKQAQVRKSLERGKRDGIDDMLDVTRFRGGKDVDPTDPGSSANSTG